MSSNEILTNKLYVKDKCIGCKTHTVMMCFIDGQHLSRLHHAHWVEVYKIMLTFLGRFHWKRRFVMMINLTPVVVPYVVIATISGATTNLSWQLSFFSVIMPIHGDPGGQGTWRRDVEYIDHCILYMCRQGRSSNLLFRQPFHISMAHMIPTLFLFTLKTLLSSVSKLILLELVWDWFYSLNNIYRVLTLLPNCNRNSVQ